MNSLVSVIIPNYNHALYLDERIQSVLNQTYQNFEIIILDDASPDNDASKSVIEKYKGNPHISHIIYNAHNSGSTFKQWNKGFHLAKGQYIWIAESDDYCKSDFLARIMDSINSENVAIAYSSSVLVDSTGKELRVSDIAVKIPVGLFNGIEFVKQYMCKNNSIWNASAVVFKKEYALQLNPIYTTFKSAGDHLFWILLAEKGDVIHIPDELNYFRQHDVKVTPQKYREGITHLEELEIVKYLKNRGYLTLHNERNIVNHYLSEILYYEYNNELVRKKILHEWRCFNLILCSVLIPYIRFREFVYSLIRRTY